MTIEKFPKQQNAKTEKARLLFGAVGVYKDSEGIMKVPIWDSIGSKKQVEEVEMVLATAVVAVVPLLLSV